ncbi:MAG: VWA domain-containing protein [Elusimicrobiota bacterium]
MLRDPAYLLWLLAACGAAAALFIRAAGRRRALTALLGDEGTLARLIPPEAPARRRLKAVLQVTALALLFLALAGPQWGVELVTTRASTRHVIVLVDVSYSMTAQDVKPNRMAKAKSELSLLLERLRGDGVGVMAFAGQPFLLSPVTPDIDAAKQLLGTLEVGVVPEPGTAIGRALRAALACLQRYQGGKAIVLLTDGEDHRTDPLGAADAAAAAGVRVFSIGIGSPEGEPLPMKDAASGAMSGYKKDKSGATIISRLGEETLREMASRTKGAYYRATASEDEVAEIAKQISELDRSLGTEGSSQRYKNRFLYPLAAALLLLLLELLLPATEAAPSRRPLARAAGAAALLALLLPAGRAEALGREAALRKGNKLYDARRYEEAMARYKEAAKPGDVRPFFNSADALYQLEAYDEAGDSFQALTDPKLPKQLRSRAFYNQGNSLMKQQRYAEAVTAYRQAVTLAPDDADARHNLAAALKFRKEPPPKKKPDDKKDPDKKDQDKKDPKDQPKGGAGQDPPPRPEPKTRPQDRMSKEDAQRLLRSADEKEKAAQRQRQNVPQPSKAPPPVEDW